MTAHCKRLIRPDSIPFRVGLLALGLVLPTQAQPAEPASAPPQVSQSAAGSSFNPRFSPDGQSILFTSQANNLVANDDQGAFLDIFLRDLATGEITLISVNSTGIGGGDQHAYSPSVSSNAQRVAFASAAANLVATDANSASDIFVRDLPTGTTRLITVATDGTSSAAGDLPAHANVLLSASPLLSADGRYVVFESYATNLVALPDTNQAPDIFCRDLELDTTMLITTGSSGEAAANGSSHHHGISSDARFVCFLSTAKDLIETPTPGEEELFVKDLETGATLWASTNVSGFFADGHTCLNPVLAENGRFVCFQATHPVTRSPVIVFRYDLDTGDTRVLTMHGRENSLLSLNDDGSTAFEDTENGGQIVVWNEPEATDTVVTGGEAHNPTLSADGTTVVFAGRTNNAVSRFFQLYTHDLASGGTRLVSITTNGSPGLFDLDITVPAVNRDGHLIAFETADSSLVEGDFNHSYDIVLRNTETVTTELISRRHVAVPARTGTTLATLSPGSISADGRVIAFASFDPTRPDPETNHVVNLMVRDRTRNITVRLDRPSSTGVVGRGVRSLSISADGKYLSYIETLYFYPFTLLPLGTCWRADIQNNERLQIPLNSAVPIVNDALHRCRISSNGRLLAFTEYADAFYGLTSPGRLFLQDLDSSEIKEIGGATAGYYGDETTNSLFSPDDRWLVFQSSIAGLTTNDLFGGTMHLYARDLQSGETRFISSDVDGNNLFSESQHPVVSADSRYVAFEVPAWAEIYRHDLLSSERNILACTDCYQPSLSGNGNVIAYEVNSLNGFRNVMTKDLTSGETALVSINLAGSNVGNGDSTSPQITSDARFVVFTSDASDLVDNDHNGRRDIFVRDLPNATTLLISLNHLGTSSGNGPSGNAALSANGQVVAFQSFASDLIPGDYNDTADIFTLRLSDGDSDEDGLDDGWEVIFFGSLERDGTGDFDGDGQTDAEEFRACTSPTDDTSLFKVLELAAAASTKRSLLWSATPGKTYQVEFKDNLNSNGWEELGDPITATSTTATQFDPSTPPDARRFYRVRLVE